MKLLGDGEYWFDPSTGRWSPDTPASGPKLREWQLQHAWGIAERLSIDNPFYRAKLGDLPTVRSPESFRTIRVTTKKDVVNDCTSHPPYGSRTVAKTTEIRHVVETSGTSGRGKEVYVLNKEDEEATFRSLMVGFWWAGVRPGKRVFLTYPVGMQAAGSWYFQALRRLKANVLAVGGYSTDRKIDILRRFGADMLIGTPSYIQHLAAVCEREGIDPANIGVESLLVAGEHYGLQWALTIQDRWSATLYEQYGSTQRAIAWACPGGVVKEGRLGVLHFPPEAAYCEVIDPATNEPAEQDSPGEVIVTPFQAIASPLLRFATDDRVRWFGPGSCPCGSPLPGVAAGDVQRYDDMLKIRGVNVWPDAMDAAILKVGGVTEYRGVVRTRTDGAEEIDVFVETQNRREEQHALVESVAVSVRQATGLRVNVTAVAYGSLTHDVAETEFIKTSRWRDERETNLSSSSRPEETVTGSPRIGKLSTTQGKGKTG